MKWEIDMGIYSKYIKRILDIVLSGTALIIFSPFLFFIACLVKLKIGSPILFSQQRPGKNEKIFTLYKFRSMTNEKTRTGNLLPDKDRLTSFGAFLRKSSIDELPELWNIFKGDMSIIGPRPLLVSYLPFYTISEKQRHDVRPGLTGLAQISGRNHLEWDKRLELDVKYVKSISYISDCKILFMTIKKVILKENVSVNTDFDEGNLAEIRSANSKSDVFTC
jgi:undecaprenyl phosphate N,N'-diacetylbacillosamine 1-phosphate transferase